MQEWQQKNKARAASSCGLDLTWDLKKMHFYLRFFFIFFFFGTTTREWWRRKEAGAASSRSGEVNRIRNRPRFL